MFVAVGYGLRRLTSADGIHWEADVEDPDNGKDKNFLLRGVTYGRAGRVAGSSCVPAASLFGPDKALKPIADLRTAFEGVGAAADKRVLVYCGGGIAATLDAFVLTAMLGHRNVSVYDNSMQEWANDPSLPMETG